MREWAATLNVAEGNAPRTAAVLKRCDAYRATCTGSALPPRRGTIASGAARMWAARWRLRWGGVYGRLRARDEPPLDEMRQKVAVFSVAVVVSHSEQLCPRRMHTHTQPPPLPGKVAIRLP